MSGGSARPNNSPCRLDSGFAVAHEQQHHPTTSRSFHPECRLEPRDLENLGHGPGRVPSATRPPAVATRSASPRRTRKPLESTNVTLATSTSMTPSATRGHVQERLGQIRRREGVYLAGQCPPVGQRRDAETIFALVHCATLSQGDRETACGRDRSARDLIGETGTDRFDDPDPAADRTSRSDALHVRGVVVGAGSQRGRHQYGHCS